MINPAKAGNRITNQARLMVLEEAAVLTFCPALA